MFFFERYITKILAQTCLNAPSKIARHMKVTPQRVNQFKHKGFRPTAEECQYVAELLGLNFEEVHFTICLDRARNDKEAEIFRQMVEKYKRPVNIPARFKPHGDVN